MNTSVHSNSIYDLKRTSVLYFRDKKTELRFTTSRTIFYFLKGYIPLLTHTTTNFALCHLQVTCQKRSRISTLNFKMYEIHSKGLILLP